jgi:peroxiredoxin
MSAPSGTERSPRDTRSGRGSRSVGAAAALPLAAAFALAAAAGVGCGGSRGGAGDEAARAAHASAEIGKPAPDFTLEDTDGRKHRLRDYTKAGKTVVLEWFNPDCPFIKKHHANSRSMAELHSEQHPKNVVWLAINSGAPGKQGAGVERNRQAKVEYAMEYPILIDEAGEVGRMYGAKTTPHMFVIAPDGTLIYGGAFDDDPSPGTLGKTVYVRAAVDALQAGAPVVTPETAPYGCSVKYAGP